MNIVTANRLYELRKKNGYSQEELAEKLGISRQAISKWERAEASPDTDNLVELAKLYGVSLDELLDINNSAASIKEEKVIEEETVIEEKVEEDDGIDIDINDGNTKTLKFKGGIHIEDGKDVVHIGKDGINVSSEDGEKVHIGFDGIKFKSNEDKEFKECNLKIKDNHSNLKSTIESIFVPLTVFGSLIAYLILGFTMGAKGWATYWVLFLLIPIVPTLIDAIFRKQFTAFAYPIFITGVYCFLGLRFSDLTYSFFGQEFTGFWHPWWFLFITIPVYYVIFGPIDDLIRNHSHKKVNVYINNEDVIDEEDE